MSDSDLQAQIAAATAYEEFFVPALFGEWVGRVADAALIQSGQDVLDVACGTGVLARHAASRVGPDGFVAGVDPSAGMLAVAARLAPKVEADLRGWLPLMGVELTEDQIHRILQETEQALAAHVTAAGTMAFEIAAHIVSGRKR